MISSAAPVLSASGKSTPSLETGATSTPDASLEELEFSAVPEPPPRAPITPPPLPEIVAAQTAISTLRSDAKFWSELGTRLWRAEHQLEILHE